LRSFRPATARRRRGLTTSTLVVLIALAACGAAEEKEPERPTGHVLTDMQGGIAVDLPTIWKGRYRMTDTLTAGDPGLERRLTLRFVKADSSVVPLPMLVISIVKADAWGALPPDSAGARYGTIIARDATRIVAMWTAPGNPLKPGTADAVAFDSLMMIVIQRPMRVSLRR
jgi:hypothetical protein